MSYPQVSRHAEPLSPLLPLLAGRNYHCQCGQPVFFSNSRCLACQTPLGYDPERGSLLPLMPGPQPGSWQEWRASAASLAKPANTANTANTANADANRADNEAVPLYKNCLNLTTPARCNWLVPLQDSLNLCRACRLNHTIPDLNNPAQPDNGYLWGLIELAKRRLVSSLILLQLPVASRVSEDPERGLMFDFLRSPVNGPHVMTGHDTGLITLNLDEADDVKRETVRKAMREPYRTLLGHFRHEVGHYYWDRLVSDSTWMDGFHQLFGDPSADYADSLKRNYDQGPPSDWPLHFVSAYASSHPWEDWAECWAHYLHMRDGIDTALSLGVSLERSDLEVTPFTLDELFQPDHSEAEQFLAFLNHWTRLTTMLNEMSRSMGLPDFYPFVLPRDVVGKLHFIHLIVISRSWLHGQSQGQTPMQTQSPARALTSTATPSSPSGSPCC
ncbi:MAG: putative zinc-binding metallopeptidase [Polaromonas sp.]